eukprot:8123622-Pyramimonas_sp.AAC.1
MCARARGVGALPARLRGGVLPPWLPARPPRWSMPGDRDLSCPLRGGALGTQRAVLMGLRGARGARFGAHSAGE